MKHVLVASLGGSPQIITEALWAMMHPARLIDPAHRDRQPVAPAAIRIVATSLAWPFASVTERDSTIRSKIAELYRQYGHEPPQVEIDALQDGGEAIPDVRTQRQNIVYANAVTRIVAGMVVEPDTVVHMLLAGGRKSMSSYDQSAMMFFGRVQDELAHVLVDPAGLEACADFWWPDQPTKIVSTKGGDKFASDSAAARIDLVNVPYVRLGVRLPGGPPGEALDYERLVEFVQFEQSKGVVIIDLGDCSVTVGGDRIAISLTNFIVLATLAVIRKACWLGVGPESEGIGGNASGWVLMNDLRFGRDDIGQPAIAPALALAAEIRDAVMARSDDKRVKRTKDVRIAGKSETRDSTVDDDWVAKAFDAKPRSPDQTSVVRSRCAKELIEKVVNPFIAERIAPNSYGKGETAAIGLDLPPDRIELHGFESFQEWISGSKRPGPP